MASIHPDICDRLLSYLDGCLDERVRREVHVHLEYCNSCSEELAALKAMTNALRQSKLDDPATTNTVERYGCPGAEELIAHASQEASHRSAENEWISRHIETCPRCRYEVDLIRLMTLQCSESGDVVVPKCVSAQVEGRLLARVRRESGGDHQAAARSRMPSWNLSFLWRAALGVGCAAAVAAWGIVRLQSDPVMTVQRPNDPDVGVVRPLPSLPDEPQQQPKGVRERSSLPALVPAKQGEELKVLILPLPTHQRLRSAVAAGLGDRLKTVLPPDREFPPEPSVDDLTANRRLGRLFGVQYILKIDVKTQPSGYLVILRAADTETGGVVATREAQTLQEKALPTVVSRLAKELQQALLEKR